MIPHILLHTFTQEQKSNPKSERNNDFTFIVIIIGVDLFEMFIVRTFLAVSPSQKESKSSGYINQYLCVCFYEGVCLTHNVDLQWF